jgi:hypothetical protein
MLVGSSGWNESNPRKRGRLTSGMGECAAAYFFLDYFPYSVEDGGMDHVG